jgi:hypothetical protein
MSNAAISLSEPAAPFGRAIATVVLPLWFATVSWLALQRVFNSTPGAVPVALIAAVLAPIAAFLLAYRVSASARRFVLEADLRLLVAMHGWRFLGFGFIALHINGVLPGIFAWPAGLGDMAVAIAAPWMALRLTHDPDYVCSRAFVAWNGLGILDLAVAVGTGALGSGLVPGLVTAGVTTAPLAMLPLSWVPTFLVPLMVMIHITGLLQARRARR